MMNLEKIEVQVAPFPISNNEYNLFMLQLANYSQKSQRLFKIFCLEIIKRDIELNATVAPPENYQIWINGEKLSPTIINQLNLKTATKDLANMEIKRYQPKEIPSVEINTPLNPITKEEQYLLERLKNVKEKATSEKYENFYYYKIPITDDYLFTQIDEHKVVKEVYLPFLRYLDLSTTDFSNTDLKNLDLSYTNISKIDFSSCYGSSIEGLNLEGVTLLGEKLENISAEGANLCGTFLEIAEDSVNLKDCKLDKSILLTVNDKVVDTTRRGHTFVKYTKPTMINY